MNKDKLPVFKYNPNVYKNGEVIFEEATCQCCGKTVTAYIENIYSADDVDCICLECVANGEAARKFNGTFVQDADRINNPEAQNVLFHRTPGYWSWQGENWAACCNDYCEYLGTVGTKELEELGIADELFDQNGSCGEWEGVRQNLTKDGHINGYLFRCLHCGKYHLRIDAD